METKIFTAPLKLKADGEPGEFKAVFATFGVTDLDGDWTIPGAFKNQEVVIEPWNHDYTLPVGKGRIKTDEKEAWIEGQFFLDTEVGKENYQTVKNLGKLAEWSYTFNVLKSTPADPVKHGGAIRVLQKMDVAGVSPVTRGAGINTRTTEIKGQQKRAISPHSTATTDVAWDGPANEARLRTGESAEYYRRAYAWQDLEADPETKTAYRFIHHMVDADGNIGAANTRACSAGIAVLNGGRGGTTIPSGDRQGVWNHLARHLRDADMEPPELKSAEGEAREGKPSDDIDMTVKLTELELLIKRLEI